jgi:regulator of PEP synthase PpsR (kinase-PPPase family)
MTMGAVTTVVLVSDSLGETAEQVTRGAAIQFNGGLDSIRLVRRSHITDAEGIRRAVTEAAASRPAVIVYTLVKPELRNDLADLADRAGIPHVDILGPVLTALSQVMGRSPQMVPGLSHRLDRDYFDRVEAIEFAVKYDDGKDPSGALKADVVILGVSRTSKTPVSLYLANHRLKVANIPLVPETPVPPEVTGPARRKCVGLVVEPETLMNIRHQRLKALGLAATSQYASMERILKELEYAWDVYQRIGCPVVDVTNHAVEETATKILEIVKREGTGA